MNFQTPARESALPASQARAGAGTALHTATDKPAAVRPTKAHCGSCGKGWFGAVAYCPYCGQPAASAPAAEALPGEAQALAEDVRPDARSNMPLFGATAGEREDQPRIG